jgi:hypothetical protein
MSAPPQVVLLDSNAYFRLARSIPQLLAGQFGANPAYSLFVLADLDDEYLTSARLKNKFEWVNAAEHKLDRRTKRYSPKGKWRIAADSAYSFLAAYAAENKLNVSREDLRALAVGLARTIPVVSDDAGMRTIAAAHVIPCWSTLELMQLMLTTKRIDLAMVTQIVEYWQAENDLPMAIDPLRKIFQEFFGSKCPV